MRQISHDPFARESILRETVFVPLGMLCDNCTTALKTKKGRSYLYQYFVESDWGTRQPIKGHFCSIGCMRAYHGN